MSDNSSDNLKNMMSNMRLQNRNYYIAKENQVKQVNVRVEKMLDKV